MTLVIGVGTGMRGETGWTYVCFSTVIRPPDAAAYRVIRSKIQSRAAPMPRTGSSWLDSVCRVPNDASLRMVASMRRASISRSSALSSRSGACGRTGWPGPREVWGAAPAAVAPPRTGAATAAAAETERNVRRSAIFALLSTKDVMSTGVDG